MVSPRMLLLLLAFFGALGIYVLLCDLVGYLRRRDPVGDRARSAEYRAAMDAAHQRILVMASLVDDEPRISKVVAWNNGDLVTCYDQYGHIMPGYCGPCLLVIPKIDKVYRGTCLEGDWFKESLEPLELHVLYEEDEL